MMSLHGLWDHGHRQETAATIEQQLELVRRDQEALEKRVRLIEDLLAAIRRDDLDDRQEAMR